MRTYLVPWSGFRPFCAALLALVAAPAVPGTAAVAAPVRPKALPADKAAQSITAAALHEHVRALTDDKLAGRQPGTPGEAEAQRYLGEQLQKAGLGAAGDGGGFVQALSLVGVRSRLVAAPTFRSLSTSIPVQIAVSSAELALHATTAVATSTLAEAEMVFVGYGITAPEFKWDDYKGVDVHGKVVLLLDGDPQGMPDRFGGPAWRRQGRFTSKLAEASRRGAAAVLLLHDDRVAGMSLDVLRSERSAALLDPSAPRDRQRPQLVGLIAEDAARRITQAGGQEWDVLRRSVETPAFAAVTLPVRLSVQLAVEAQPVESANVVVERCYALRATSDSLRPVWATPLGAASAGATPGHAVHTLTYYCTSCHNYCVVRPGWRGVWRGRAVSSAQSAAVRAAWWATSPRRVSSPLGQRLG